MSIRFSQPRPVVKEEDLYWRVRKGQRTAEARVRVVNGLAHELRIDVDQAAIWSRVYRTQEEFKFLNHQSERCREYFERFGWRDRP